MKWLQRFSSDAALREAIRNELLAKIDDYLSQNVESFCKALEQNNGELAATIRSKAQEIIFGNKELRLESTYAIPKPKAKWNFEPGVNFKAIIKQYPQPPIHTHAAPQINEGYWVGSGGGHPDEAQAQPQPINWGDPVAVPANPVNFPEIVENVDTNPVANPVAENVDMQVIWNHA